MYKSNKKYSNLKISKQKY